MNKPNNIESLQELRRKAIQLLKKDLPRGYKTEITKRSGLCYRTVLRFFNGHDNEKLYKVFQDYVTEHVKETKKILYTAGIEIPSENRSLEDQGNHDTIDD
ncbi:MAG: hypothetical protein HQ521_06000 [Bacteroidetes bacterium]|nr:hypothetical protein [Bacteroidota bacterium]